MEGHSSLLFRGLRPFLLAGKIYIFFFQRKVEPKDKWRPGHRHLPFRCFSFSFSFSGASPRFGVQDAFGPHNAGKAEVFFSKRKRQSKRKITARERPPPFPLLPAFLFLFLSPSFSAASYPSFFSSKKQKKEKIKEKIENILFSFSFSCLLKKERKAEEEKDKATFFPPFSGILFFRKRRRSGENLAC